MKEILKYLFNYLAQFPHETIMIVAVVILFFGAIVEAFPIGIFMPMESTAVFLGILAYKGILDIKILILASFLGMIIGDINEYFFGKKVGEKYLKKYLEKIKINDKKFEKIKKIIKNNLFKAIFLGRNSSWSRWIVPFLCGAHKINTVKFISLDIITAFFWAFVYLLGGYYLGYGFDLYGQDAGISILVFVLIAFAGYKILKRKKSARHTELSRK